VTDVVKHKKEVEKIVQDLRQERDLRERFVATLTHDLRTPLTAAKMSTQLLARKSDDPAVIQMISGRIADNINRADQMIRDLLDANRLRAGEKLPIQINACDLNQIASEVLEELSTLHGDRFVLHASSHIEGYWSGSGMRRILENLCNNAIKYGAPYRPIMITLKSMDQNVEISVHNEGSPISPEDQNTLFQPYRRTESAQIGKQRGWGLGLTLVRGIAEAHGGWVKVESSVSEGTTFSVQLPIDARNL
jgi:signal transduction histidine kinase